MSNLKKIALAISIFLIGILGFATITRAAEASKTRFVDEEVYVNDYELYRNLHLFCLVPDAERPLGTYNRFAHIKIEGNIATNVDTGVSGKPSKENAMLAYMLNNATKTPKDDYIPDRTSTLRAMGWLFFPKWWNTTKTELKIGGNIKVEGCNESKVSEAIEEYRKLYKKAEDYASSYQGSEIQKQGTGKKVTIAASTIDNVQYYKIGPFKCKFSNNLESITVNTDNGNYTPSMYIQNKSGSEKSINISQIESEQNFYINIKADKYITKINYITIKGMKVTTYGADLYIYKVKNQPANQNFAYFEPSSKEIEPSVKYDLNLPVEGELQIKKIDTSGNNNVNGIGFKVYSQVADKTGWLQIDKDGKITYTTFKYATELITDTRAGLAGYTEKIIGMPVGKYSIYETNLGPHSYLYSLGTCEVPEGTNINEKITVTAKKIEEKDIYGTYTSKAENTPVYGALQINKVDEAGNALEGIGFKIYSHISGKEGWLVLDEDANLTGYAKTIDKVESIYTEENGKTLIVAKLPAGKYTIYETDVGKYSDIYGLEEVAVPGGTKAYIVKNNVKDVTVEANGIANKEIVEVKNTPDLGSLIIHKVDKAGNPLYGIGFKIYSEVPGKEGWLNINNGTGKVLSYVEKIDEVEYDLITGSDGNTHLVDKLPAGKYKIYETNVGKYDDIYALTLTDVPGGTKAYVKNIGEVEVKATGTAEKTLYTETNIPDYGSLAIKKVDKYTRETLPGIGFKVYSNVGDKKGWLTINADNELTGYTSFDRATEILTQDDGITNLISKLPAGQYSIYETSLGNYVNTYKLEEIEVPGEREIKTAKFIESVTVEAKGTDEPAECEAENIPQFIKLSGYVWLDRQSQKQTIRNDLFKEDDNDSADMLLKGIKVGLYYRIYTGQWDMRERT